MADEQENTAPAPEESEPVASDPTPASEGASSGESKSLEAGSSPVDQPNLLLIYDGDPMPHRALRAAYPLGRVEAHTSRTADGLPYYDVRAGQYAFIPNPGGKVYFAGEEVK